MRFQRIPNLLKSNLTLKKKHTFFATLRFAKKWKSIGGFAVLVAADLRLAISGIGGSVDTDPQLLLFPTFSGQGIRVAIHLTAPPAKRLDWTMARREVSPHYFFG